MDIFEAIDVMTKAGAVVLGPFRITSVSLEVAGASLGFSADWVRDHIDEFPNAWRAPGGRRTNGGELRVPLEDLSAFVKRQRIGGPK